MTALALRSWQAEFLRRLKAHKGDEFLLVACPAAGKTIGASAGAASVMAARECDQLIVVCPTVVVRDQWKLALRELDYRMVTQPRRWPWPDHVHGICATYAQVSMRVEEFAAACESRRTVVVFDEIHHAGQQLAWGLALEEAFSGAAFRLALSGTPFRSDGDLIPFVRYGPGGACEPDFAYDYPRAVREGVCRPVEFRAHDGEITWREDGGGPRTATFEESIEPSARPRRLRASLDPSQPYLQELLGAAHDELVRLRGEVPNAAGLVVCDTQAHALEVDRLLNEIAGSAPALAISDLPQSHETIAAFAANDELWLVSVRMVAEGVDIPRLGAIVWATAASTELMVRQVTGRALRGRNAFAGLPAIVHMPADEQLIEYARRLDVLGGVSARPWRPRDSRSTDRRRDRGRRTTWSQPRIDPAPFVRWFDRQAEVLGGRSVCTSCGWSYESGMARLRRWRSGATKANALTIFDACHMAGIDFDDLFEAPEYAEARGFVANPEAIGRAALEFGELDFGCVEATCNGGDPLTIAPALPAATAARIETTKPIVIPTPDLPPSPAAITAAKQTRKAAQAELFRLLNVYARLRQEATPAYQLATAHGELAAALGGTITGDSTDEAIGEAIAWVREQTAALAHEHPEQLLSLARRRRRHVIAQEAA